MPKVPIHPKFVPKYPPKKEMNLSARQKRKKPDSKTVKIIKSIRTDEDVANA